MWQQKQAQLLQGEIEAVLTSLPDVKGLRNLVREPLSKARRGLSPDAGRDRPWPLLPMIVSESISGRCEPTVRAAAALQFLLTACDVFDDIEDADSPDSLSAKYGAAVATNVATALLFLGEKAIGRCYNKSLDDETLRVLDVINSYYLKACAGQHLDLSSSGAISISEEQYLQIAGMKSALLIECACRVGAMLATENAKLIDIYASFGHNLGMASQITNDVQGIIEESDIRSRKITLPVIFALAKTGSEADKQVKLAYGNSDEEVPGIAQTKDALFRTGAIQYATVKIELYKQLALDSIHEAESAGVVVERVKLFVT